MDTFVKHKSPPYERGKGILVVFPAQAINGIWKRTGMKTDFSGLQHPYYFNASSTRVKRDIVTKYWKKEIWNGLNIHKHFYAAKKTGANAMILAGVSFESLKSCMATQAY